ncbi:MAG: hypothetical protein QJR09_12545 [Micrococcus sp.]|nr:hypothetical protein [Micrococcus sp.]
MQQHPPVTDHRVPGTPHPHTPGNDSPEVSHPYVPTDRVPGAPHPLALQGRDPARARRESLMFSVLALITLAVPPLPFVFGALAVVRAGDAGRTSRPALGQALGIVALVLSAAVVVMAIYAFPALVESVLLQETVDPWLWWKETGRRILNAPITDEA